VLWNLSVANNKSLRVCFVCFLEHKGLLEFGYFHAKSCEESRGSTSSGKLMEFSLGKHSKRPKKKKTNVHSSIDTHQLPEKLESGIHHLFLGIDIALGFGEVFCFFT
jgi:hypothetical protein